jgi:hypothetical protein
MQQKSTINYHNNLNDTLMCHKIAKHLGLDKGNETALSPQLTKLFAKELYISKGYDDFRDSVKGYAVLGFIWDIIKDRHDELNTMSTLELNQAKNIFFQTRGIDTKNLQQTDYDKLDILDLCLWEGLKDRPFVAPTSGSFGIGFLNILRILRNRQIQVSGQKVALLDGKSKEGNVRPWVPNLGLDIMSPDKTHDMDKLALSIGCDVKYWKDRNTRDIVALVDALRTGGFFCPTNPKSQSEVQELVNNLKIIPNITQLLNTVKAQDALKYIGVEFNVTNGKNIQFKATKPLTAGITSLSITRLKQLEDVLRFNPMIQKITTYNQPSVGATFAGMLKVDEVLQNAIKNHDILDYNTQAMLQEHFPNIFQKVFIERQLPDLRIKATFDVANRGLAEQYGAVYTNYPHNNNAANGLGTITTGQGGVDAIDEHLASKKPSFNGGSDMYIVPHNFMNIAQALMFVANNHDKIPELAGAASLGGLMHKKFLKGKIQAKDYAQLLADNGITKEVLFKIVDKEYFDNESNKHGGKAQMFSADFLNSIDKKSTNNHTNVSNLLQDKSKAYIVMNTGSNGMEVRELKAREAIAKL